MSFFLTNFISALFSAQTALFSAQIFLQFGHIQYKFAAINQSQKNKMKNLLTLFLITFSCSMALALGSESFLQVKLYSSMISDESEKKSNENTGIYHRMPTRPILCSISIEDGVSFDDGSNPEIISYEIKDADNNPIAITGDEADFIQTLFSLTGEYVIQFRTDECVYYGSICF